ncbi:MAG TPA: hypothetical protein VLI93_09845 [Acetobacteraceae bacterium]|nr:hypothetical protein [Acetobacteraceae bacterium]
MPTADSSLFPRTHAVRRALSAVRDLPTASDLLFLEAWETHPAADVAATLRAGQIRRANPMLAAEIRAEVSRGHPLSDSERASLPRPG